MWIVCPALLKHLGCFQYNCDIINTTAKNTFTWFYFYLHALLAAAILRDFSEYSPRSRFTGQRNDDTDYSVFYMPSPLASNKLFYILYDVAQNSYSRKTSPTLFPDFLGSLSF